MNWTTEESWFVHRRRQEICLFSHESIEALKSTNPPIQPVEKAFSWGKATSLEA
jgi:hypothetical protein